MSHPRRVTLYGHWICPYSTRIEFALHQRRIVHDVVDVPPTAVREPGYVVPREFTEHSPRLEIPMVRVDADYRSRAERCERLAGWEAVRWSRAQPDEFVGRFEAHRRQAVSAG